MEQGVKSIHFESLPLFCSPPDFTRFSQSSSIFQNFCKPYPPPHPLYKGGVLVHTMKEVNHFTTTIQPTTAMLTLKKILVSGKNWLHTQRSKRASTALQKEASKNTLQWSGYHKQKIHKHQSQAIKSIMTWTYSIWGLCRTLKTKQDHIFN